MKAYTFCKAERDGHVLIVTINRPEVMNALHRPANLELDQIFNEFAADPTLWLAILTGAGDKAFSAGNDLKYQAQGNDTAAAPGGFGGITARFDLNKPVIAAVNGLAMGGGFEIALACDLIIASEKAVFALPEPRVGMAAMAGGLLRLPRQIPLKQAMSMIVTGRRVSAAQGLTFGFVNEVAPHGQTLEAAKRWAAEIIEGSPMSLRASKEVVYRGLDGDSLAAAYREQRMYPAVKAHQHSEDRVEGLELLPRSASRNGRTGEAEPFDELFH